MTGPTHPPQKSHPPSGRVVALLLVVVLLVGAGGGAYLLATRPPSPPKFKSLGPTVERLESMGRLTVVKLSIADVLEGRGYGYKGAWLIRGDVLYAVDMGDAEVVAIDEAEKTATILLPTPELLQPRVDHSRTVTYSVERTNLIPGTGDQSRLRDESMKRAQQRIEEAASGEEYMAVARLNAELVLRNMYALVDWSVKVAWEGQPQARLPRDDQSTRADAPPTAGRAAAE